MDTLALITLEVVTSLLYIRSQPGTWSKSINGLLHLGQRIIVDPTTRVDDGILIWFKHSLGWSASGRVDGTQELMREVSPINPQGGIALKVKWLSQLGVNAPGKFDCGQACVLMLPMYSNLAGKMRVADLTKLIDGRTSPFQLQSLAARFGLSLKAYVSTNDDLPKLLRERLDQGRPVILLVDYVDLGFPVHLTSGNNQGLHWLVVIGYTDLGFIVNDPLWAASQRSGLGGGSLEITTEKLVKAARMQHSPVLA